MGAYQNMVNGKDGSITAGDNRSPITQLQDIGSDSSAVPALSKWSDIVAIEWQKHASGTLNYIFRSNVQNLNTKGMILQAFETSQHSTVPEYPGVDFTINSDGTGVNGASTDPFYGLLGTYHASGPAYLLAQHQALFGQRRIRTIRVWNQGSAWPTDGSGDITQLVPSMLLFVEAV